MSLAEFDKKVNWLFNQFPVFQKVGSEAFKPTLDNAKALVKFLNVPLEEMTFVHVAGTNGKGTTCSIIASALTEAGKKTGLFTSPHIKDFRERMRINGEMISRDKVIEYISRFQKAEFDFSPSFFEMTWAMALAYFYEEKCDIIVVETGLGGRLDATNIIQPILSIITNIGLDHIDILGDTRKKIAAEKAGIIKANTPVLIGESDNEVNPVLIKKARSEGALMYIMPPIREKNVFLQNEKVAFKALDDVLLKDLSKAELDAVKEKAIINLSKNTGWFGRYQIYSKDPLIIIDVAHNPMGAERLLEDIQESYKGKRIRVLYGSSNDKDINTIINILPEDWEYYFTEFTSKRSTKIEEFEEVVKNTSLNVKYFKDAKKAFENAKVFDNKVDMLLVFGSFYLLDEII